MADDGDERPAGEAHHSGRAPMELLDRAIGRHVRDCR